MPHQRLCVGIPHGSYPAHCSHLCVFLGRFSVASLTSICNSSFVGMWRYFRRPTHTLGVMCYVTAVFVLSGVLLSASHTPRICFCVSFLGFRCLPVRNRSWFPPGALLLRRAFLAMLAVSHMGLSVVFPVVLGCFVVGIAHVAGVGIRLLAPLVRFRIARLRNLPSGSVN